MTNEKAVWLLMNQRKKTLNPDKKLACDFAMGDIVSDDIDNWINTPIHEHMWKFISLGGEIVEEMSQHEDVHECETKELMDSIMQIPKCMYHYARMHHYITDKSLSES